MNVPYWSGPLRVFALAFSLVLLLLVTTYAFAVSAPGCSSSIPYNSATQGFDSADYNLLMIGLDTSETRYKGSFFLDMGQQVIRPDAIVIPFKQEVCVSFFYEDAGYTSTLGWLRGDQAVFDDTGRFSWVNTPTSAKHPIFSQVSDGSGGGDGVLDAVAADTETTLKSKGFTPWEDGVVNAKDMRKCLGTFDGGSELVFWLANNDGDWSNSRSASTSIFYTKPTWNPDTFKSCLATQPSHSRSYLLGQANTGGGCTTTSKGFLDANAITRLSSVFGLNMSGTYGMTVNYNQLFQHVIVAAPDGDPNQWILSWEDLKGGGDMDYNDITFRIERKNGGTVTMNPVTPQDLDATATAETFYTAVAITINDFIPACAGNRIDYYVSADNGLNWVAVNNWEKIRTFVLNDDGTRTPGALVDNWTPGNPPMTTREARVDFVGLNQSGRELVWKAEMRSDVSDDSACVPRILATSLEGSTATPRDLARSSPIMAGNLLYSGSFRTAESSWTEKRPRGMLRASKLYEPMTPGTALTPPVTVWEAGAVLNAVNPDNRKIFFPDISANRVVIEPLALAKPDGTAATSGDGTTTVYTGTLSFAPVLATSVRLFAGTKEFHDEGPGLLTGNWGSGAINRFSGDFVITFDQAPSAAENFSIEYAYYAASTSSTLQALKNDNVRVTDALLGLDGRVIDGSRYVYDFNADNTFSAADRQKLVSWTRGAGRDWKLGAIDHSVPALMVPPSKPDWYFGTDTGTDTKTSYDTFASTLKERSSLLFVGARDGMLHAFDAGQFRWGDNPSTSLPLKEKRGYFAWHDHDGNPMTATVPNYGSGREEWAFIPSNLLPRLKNNYLNRTSQDGDQAFVDASPTLADVRINGACTGASDCLGGTCSSGTCTGGWKTVLLFAEGNGGDSVVCLDVTNPVDPRYLWEYADPELFRSRSSPAVGQIGRLRVDGVEKWAAFFVSGKTYDANLYPSIYLIDIADGSLIDRIYLDAVAEDGAAPSGRGGVPSGQPAIVDVDGNGYIDRLYIGTDKGLLYKVNLSDDPAAFWSATSTVVINNDIYDDNAASTVNGQPNPVPATQRWHPIYASPTVVVEHSINTDGTTQNTVRILFGTGDNPQFDESIDVAGTTYHFFAYVDRAPKGSTDPYQVELDWFYPLTAGQRVFASAFASAGKIYFGTATSDTEDPCDGDNEGKLYAFDLTGYDDSTPAQPSSIIDTGDITTTPVVEDEHLFVRTAEGTMMVGGGGFNNATKVGGLGSTQPAAWLELSD